MSDITEKIALKVNQFVVYTSKLTVFSIAALCNGLNNCTSAVHGVCVSPDTCSCNPGYTGADCSQKTFCTHDCSGKGICLGNEKCSCNFDWAGSKCDEASCESSLFCSGNPIVGTVSFLKGIGTPAPNKRN